MLLQKAEKVELAVEHLPSAKPQAPHSPDPHRSLSPPLHLPVHQSVLGSKKHLLGWKMDERKKHMLGSKMDERKTAHPFYTEHVHAHPLMNLHGKRLKRLVFGNDSQPSAEAKTLTCKYAKIVHMTHVHIKRASNL